MMLLVGIANVAFVFALTVLAWWHGASMDLRVALAGIYFLVGTVATVGASVLFRLERRWPP
jgi:hypothetical protein